MRSSKEIWPFLKIAALEHGARQRIELPERRAKWDRANLIDADKIGRKKTHVVWCSRNIVSRPIRKRTVACILDAGISGALDRSRRSVHPSATTSQHPAFSTESLMVSGGSGGDF